MEEGLVTLACVLKSRHIFPSALLKWFLARVKSRLFEMELHDAMRFHHQLFRSRVSTYYLYPFLGVMTELKIAVDKYQSVKHEKIDEIMSVIKGEWGYGVHPCRFKKYFRWRRVVCMEEDARAIAEGTFILARSESLMKMREREGIQYGLRPRKKNKSGK